MNEVNRQEYLRLNGNQSLAQEKLTKLLVAETATGRQEGDTLFAGVKGQRPGGEELHQLLN